MSSGAERPHVSHGALYLYRDSEDAMGWPDVLATPNGAYLCLDPDEADAVAEVIEEARSFAPTVGAVHDLSARVATLTDLLARMRDWCLSGDEPDAPDGTPSLLDVVNAAVAARPARPPATEEHQA